MSTKALPKIDLNKVDEDTRNLLNGFTRNIQKSMTLTIPDPIIFIILSFYYFPEYFKDFAQSIFQYVGNNKDDKKIIKSISDNRPWSSIYGNVLISSHKKQKYVWKFRINKFKDPILIGISSTYDVDKRFFVSNDGYNYCYYSNGEKVSHSNHNDYSQPFGENDIITMILDCNLKQLSFHKNDDDLGVAYDNIECGEDIKYKMAMYIYYKNVEVELLEFKFL